MVRGVGGLLRLLGPSSLEAIFVPGENPEQVQQHLERIEQERADRRIRGEFNTHNLILFHAAAEWVMFRIAEAEVNLEDTLRDISYYGSGGFW